MKEEIAAGGGELPQALREGTFSPEQLSGITHGDCEEFSRDFGVLLDVEELVPGGEYTLEASSPGLDRKLRTTEDFERFQGNLVKVQTFEPMRNNRHWQGRLTQVSETKPGAPGFTIDLGAVKQNSKSRKAGVTTVEIALNNVEKAQLDSGDLGNSGIGRKHPSGAKARANCGAVAARLKSCPFKMDLWQRD